LSHGARPHGVRADGDGLLDMSGHVRRAAEEVDDIDMNLTRDVTDRGIRGQAQHGRGVGRHGDHPVTVLEEGAHDPMARAVGVR